MRVLIYWAKWIADNFSVQFKLLIISFLKLKKMTLLKEHQSFRFGIETKIISFLIPLSIHPSVHPFVCLSVCLSVYLFVYSLFLHIFKLLKLKYHVLFFGHTLFGHWYLLKSRFQPPPAYNGLLYSHRWKDPTPIAFLTCLLYVPNKQKQQKREIRFNIRFYFLDS